ncbi:MAG: 50S ribosomal protein L2 [Candidatus Levyibacteriota bacterium]
MAKLKHILKKNSGRDSSGQVMVRHQGGRHKRFYRVVDFKRDKRGIEAEVLGIEYDPNRSADLALLQYKDGEKRYILRPVGLDVGKKIMADSGADLQPGNALPLMEIPVGTFIHNIELTTGRGGQIARSAGDQAVITARENTYVHVKMPSGEVRKILGKNYATIGQVGNVDWKDRVLGKAGRSIHLGIRPSVRGVAMNPRSHPHGGGEGRSGIGMNSPKTYAGRKAVGKTRRPKKYSNKFIVSRRKKSK